ncbi:MAG: FMN-binding protein, partial [Nitrospina sp.]
IRKEKKWLTDSQIAAITELSGQKFTAKRLKFYVGIKNGKVMGTMSIGNEIGRSYPITFMVVINPDGTVKDVEVMVYREPHGWEVRFDSFLSQFFGQNAHSPFDNIHNITGATMSVRSMTRGIKKALAAYQVLFLDQVE